MEGWTLVKARENVPCSTVITVELFTRVLLAWTLGDRLARCALSLLLKGYRVVTGLVTGSVFVVEETRGPLGIRNSKFGGRIQP